MSPEQLPVRAPGATADLWRGFSSRNSHPSMSAIAHIMIVAVPRGKNALANGLRGKFEIAVSRTNAPAGTFIVVACQYHRSDVRADSLCPQRRNLRRRRAGRLSLQDRVRLRPRLPHAR